MPPSPGACSLSKNLLCWVARARGEKQPCFLRGPPKRKKRGGSFMEARGEDRNHSGALPELLTIMITWRECLG